MGLRTWVKGQVKQMLGIPQARFEAARPGRLSEDFFRPTTSADTEIQFDLQTLRNSARALSRDNPQVRGIKRTFRINVIGSRGIQYRPQVKQLSGKGLDERRNAILAEEKRKWCRRDCCDVTGKNSMLSFQLHIPAALVDSGELFFRIHRGQKFGRSTVPLALEMIEADQVDVDYNHLSDRPGHKWTMGIETDKWNRPTRYAILTQHPGDRGRQARGAGVKHIFVSAADIIHVYGIEERVNQTRCEPILTPVVITSHNLREYQKSHLVKKRSQANQLGWIQTPGEFDGELVDNQRTVNSEAGIYRRLNPGEIPIPPNYGPEDTVYPEVVKDSLRAMAVGTGSNYSTVSGDFSEGSYASLRISVFENRDYWRMLHTAIEEQFCQRIDEEWVYAAALSGTLPSPVFDDYWFRPDRYTNPKWQPRSWGLLDTSKDVAALKDARILQLESHSTQISDYNGGDFTGTMDEIQFENNYKDAKNLLSPIDDPAMAIKAKQPAAPQPPNPD